MGKLEHLNIVIWLLIKTILLYIMLKLETITCICGCEQQSRALVAVSGLLTNKQHLINPETRLRNMKVHSVGLVNRCIETSRFKRTDSFRVVHRCHGAALHGNSHGCSH